MSVLAGFLALGTIDPTSGAFTEASYDTYARQAVTFDIAPAGNGSVDVNSNTLANSNAPVFPNPSALDWPSLNAYAVFSAASGGQPLLYTSLGGRSGVHTRGTTRTIRIGTLGLSVKDGILNSSFGGWVTTSASPVVLAGGVLQIGSLPGITPALTRIRRTDRLRRCRQRAKAYNPYALDVAVGVTVTVGSSLDASLTKSWAALAGGVIQTGRYRFGGGIPTVYGSAVKFPVASLVGATSTTGNFAGTYTNGLSADIYFTTEAAKFAIAVTPQAGTYPATGFRLLVNGRYVNKAMTTFPAGAVNYILVDFSGVRDLREIKLESQQQNMLFNGVYTSPADDVFAHPPVESLIHLGFGDSYNEPQGTGVVGPAATRIFGNLIGASDSRQFAIGGTGYSSGGTSLPGVARFVDQIPLHLALNSDINPANVDVITLIGGLNDYNANNANTGNQPLATAAQMQTLVTEWLTRARATFPNAVILISGVAGINRNLDAVTLALEAGVSAAIAAWAVNDSLVGFIPLSSAPVAFQYGTGVVGTPANNGPNDYDLSADAKHPSDAGYTRLAGRMAAAYDGLLASLAA